MNGIIAQTLYLLQKDLLLDWRQGYAISSILLYVCSSVMVAYMAFIEIDAIAWVAVFWLIMLFASVNATTKSFVQEGSGRLLYYYTVVSPQAVILSKMIYNVGLLLVLAILTLGIYSLLLGNPVQNIGLFLTAVVLGVVGFGCCFTLIAAIAAKTGNRNATLMPILSFPVIIPMLGLLIVLSKNAAAGIQTPNTFRDIQNLVAIDAVLAALAFLLFPYLWKE
ncbi:MAG TPA: heme exporter protein CcmB [Chitinophagales bacterium]|nr:heme exporter protein CcmB [Chitinophagales bacterium]